MASTNNIGKYTSLAVVNGNPAISYYDVTNGDLYYVSASEETGTSWNTPVQVASTNNIGQYTSLVVVNGNPAISYYDVTNGDLKYIRSSNASGTIWGSVVPVDATGDVGSYASLCVVNGKPAISYYNATAPFSLKYVQASDSSGATWGTPVVLATNSTSDYFGTYTTMVATSSTIYVGFYSPNLKLPCMYVGRIDNGWLGLSTDWYSTGNWSTSAVPIDENVTINNSVSFYPNISTGTGSCNNFSIASGASTTVSGTGTLQIAGTISNSGTFDVSDGSIELNGTAAQTIPASTFTSNTIKNLTLNNSAGATLSGTLNLTGTYAPTSGTLTTGGFLTLKSDVSGTATVAAGSSSGGYMSGNVIVERYIPVKRAWRFITSPFTGSSNNSIFYNWQNNDVVNGTTGLELWTTSANGGVSNPSSANSGLALGGGNSILSYTSGVGWSAVTNTNTTNLFTSTGNNSYCVFISGPFANGAGNIYGGATQTVFKAKGTLRAGDITVSAGTVTANQFYLVGNPFASPVNPNTLSGTNLSNSFYMWDPNLSGTYGSGGYVAYDRTLNQYNIITASYSNTPVSQIQSGQAFFIQASATAATNIIFEEADKSSTVNNGQFRTTSNGFENLFVRLEKDFEGNSVYTGTDGVVASFHASIGAKAIDYYDVVKLNSGSDIIALQRSGVDLSFEHRPLVSDKDTIYLNLSNTSAANYRFTIHAEDFSAMAGLTAVLRDNYLNTETNLNLTGATTTISFNVTSDAATTGTRFVIYFRPSSVLPVDFMGISAKAEGSSVRVNWNVASEKDVARYEVERSTNGNSFDKIGSVNVANTSSYGFTDAHPNTGVNYYRIRSIDVNGSSKLSSVVTVKMNGESEFSIYPNPVKDRKIEIKLSDATAGKYTLRLINATGQVMYSMSFDHNGGSLTKNVELAKELLTGVYQAEIINGNDRKVQQIIIY